MRRTGFSGIAAAALAVNLLGAAVPGARGQAVEKLEETTPIQREWKQVQFALVTGDYEKAYEREEVARALADKETTDDDVRMLSEAVCDSLRAEIHSAKGYFVPAKSALERVVKKVGDRAAYHAKRGYTAAELRSYNLRIGYAHLCLGDNALLEEVVDSVIKQRDIKNKAKNSYESGEVFIKGVVAEDPRLKLLPYVRSLLIRCELRTARSLALAGDAIAAEGHFRQAEGALRKEPRWIKQFDPSGEAEKAIPGQPQEGAGTPPPAPGSVAAADEELEMAKTALLYIDMLNVECEMHLAAKPPRVPEAEAAASRARDIAEERFPLTAVYWHSLVNLARAYCAGNEIQLQKAAKDPNNVVQIDGQVVNVNAKAAETYRLDVEDLVSRAERASRDFNAAQPIHFQIHAVKRKLAEDRKDGPALRKLDEELKMLVERRKADKLKKKS